MVITVVNFLEEEELSNQPLAEESPLQQGPLTSTDNTDNTEEFNLLMMLQQTMPDPTDSSFALSLLGSGVNLDERLIPVLYTYNERNQLTEAHNGDTTLTNTFNAEGLRDSKTAETNEGTVITTYSYEYDRVIKEVDSESGAAYTVC